MRFLHPEHDVHLELSLDDVFLVPGYHDGGSRLSVDLTPRDAPGGCQPLVSANMNAVTGKRMAESMARYGGLGVLPQDMAMPTVERIVHHVKRAPVACDTALVASPEATVRDLRGIIDKRAHGVVIVVDGEGRPIGVVSHADLRNIDQYAAAREVMSPPATLPMGRDHRTVYLELEARRLKAAPVVDGEGRVVGVLTREDLVRFSILRPALDGQGRLVIGAAIGIGADAAERAAALVALGVDVLVLDTAHGHQRRMLEALQEVRAVVGPAVPLVAGNVCTAVGTEALLEAGADVVKVNVGPGAMCTTRMKTGAGRPTFSSVRDCARAARARGKHVWADGGVRDPRDVALYLAAGAARVMVGTMLAGTFEAPGDLREDADGRYKENYGMASARAVRDRSAALDPFEQARKSLFRVGISTSRVYLRPGLESVGALVVDLITGVQSALTYAGATDLESFHEVAVIGVQTPSGYGEGKPRPVRT